MPNVPAELSKLPYDRGDAGMARAQDPNSPNSQYYNMFDYGHYVNNQYTGWARVNAGMEYVDKKKLGAQGSGAVTDPDRMIKVQVAADKK
jgi:cyclophilin family peptidyl-prolyl cis-trans isomerase